MTNEFRAMCAELVEALHEHTCLYEGHESELVARARCLLAQPVAEGPTIAELWELYEEMADEPGDWAWVRDYALAALAKWGRPTPQPVAEWEPMPLPGDAEGLAEVFWAQPVAEGPTIPSSTLHRQELTPSEVTLLNTFWRSR